MSECLFDFPHAAVWCPACWSDQQQGQVITEMRRANDLKAQELLLRDQRDDDWRPAPKPVQYTPARPAISRTTVLNPLDSNGKPTVTRKGGMNIEPQ